MKSFYVSCPLCYSTNNEILFPANYKGKVIEFEYIVICRECGTVYKNPIIPENEIEHYHAPKHWAREYFAKKLERTATIVNNYNIISTNDLVVDIGAARGDFLAALQVKSPDGRFIGVEPSVNACREASIHKKIQMIPAMFEECQFEKLKIKLITAIGVDYLFNDHNWVLSRISELIGNDGYFYVERNLFITSQALVGHAINSVSDLFGRNSLMKNWFSVPQMEYQLQKYFYIEKREQYVSNIIDGKKNVHYGWLCKNTATPVKVLLPREYDTNKKIIKSLC